MSAEIIYGKPIVNSIREEIKTATTSFIQRGVRPGLAVIIVGDDPASMVYVQHKAKACEDVGFYSEVHRLPATTTQAELIEFIHRLNIDDRIHGILVQSPLPKHIQEFEIVEVIHPDKDVDCFHPYNVGRLMTGKPAFLPCTPAGVIELLKRKQISIVGKHAVVVGRSQIVGKPMAMLLLAEHATVTICHSKTVNLAEITQQADILVVAVGIAQFIRHEHVKPGSVVIDVGINRSSSDQKLVGDVHFDQVKEVAGYITPVPGTVGPMTITMLLKNNLLSAERFLKKKVSGA
jgi:methylenetetrahydrofolate dehydrogenase (NADP+)/methenyltetrahydrofolate cyclohydrolase